MGAPNLLLARSWYFAEISVLELTAAVSSNTEISAKYQLSTAWWNE